MNVFEECPEIFDAMIDWPKRLANEEPFYRDLFSRIGVSRVLDVACGTGNHIAMFHGWGVHAQGADVSPAMLAIARQRHGTSERLNWVQRGFGQPVTTGPFDATICVGNSLALAPDAQTAGQVVRQMLSAVRPGGAIVVHILNLWSLPEGPCTWHKSLRRTLKAGEVLILRGVHCAGQRAFIELVVLDVNSGARLYNEAVPLLLLDAAQLQGMALAAGAARVTFFGGYQGQAYQPRTSVDLIMVAER